MKVPGSNLLNKALKLISRQTFTYFAFTGRALDKSGTYLSSYADGVPMSGSVQPVPRTLYERMGLDFQKNYMTFFVPNNLVDVARDVSGDQFLFGGKCFQCLSKVPWYEMDGWTQMLTVEVPYERAISQIRFGFDRFHQNFDHGNFVNA